MVALFLEPNSAEVIDILAMTMVKFGKHTRRRLETPDVPELAAVSSTQLH
jgi:hypothetical protein